MSKSVAGPEIEKLIQLLARVPGLGPRSARRAALHLIKKKEQVLEPLAEAMAVARDSVTECATCGNVDTRDLVVGCTFWLPVLAEGALFSTGDCHSAQGQGEVSGTGIESPMTVTMRFNVRKDLNIP